MQETKLRDRGIYILPDRREFIVRLDYDGDNCSLYSPFIWPDCSTAEYCSRTDGRLLNNGTPTRWSLNDLTYTGRMAKEDNRARAAAR